MKNSFCFALILLLALGSCRLTSLVGSTQIVPDRLQAADTDNSRLKRASTRNFVEQPGETLWLMAYNTFLRPSPVNWGDKNECRAVEIGKQLAQTPADIVVLTETFDPPRVAELVEQVSEAFPFRALQKPAGRGLKTNGGLSIFSRYPIESIDTAPFDACHGTGDCMAKKGFLHALVKVSSDLKLNVLATHLDAGGSRGARQARHQQLDTIERYIDRTPAFRRWPTTMMGDLNVDGMKLGSDADPEYENLMGRLGNTCVGCETDQCRANCNSPAQDAFRAVHGPWEPNAVGSRQVNTNNCKAIGLDDCASPNDNRHWEARKRIDYIFTLPSPRKRPDLEMNVLSAGHPPFKSDACGTTYLSDHRAVTSRVRIGPAGLRANQKSASTTP